MDDNIIRVNFTKKAKKPDILERPTYDRIIFDNLTTSHQTLVELCRVLHIRQIIVDSAGNTFLYYKGDAHNDGIGPVEVPNNNRTN